MGESTSRVLIWAPGIVADLRPVLHKAGFGSAVLVAVEQGTVIIPTGPLPVSFAASWAHKCKQAGGPAIVLIWDDEAAMVYPVTALAARGWAWGSDQAVNQMTAHANGYGPLTKVVLAIGNSLSSKSRASGAKHLAAAGRIGAVLGAGDAVLEQVQRWEQGGPDAMTHLMEGVGKPDVAELVRLTHSGAFDGWNGAPTMPRRSPMPMLGLVVALFVLTILLPIPPVVSVVVLLILMASCLLMLARIMLPRLRIRRSPVDVVLSVVRVVDGQLASDSQSAK
jgi:hypothetical protein